MNNLEKVVTCVKIIDLDYEWAIGKSSTLTSFLFEKMAELEDLNLVYR
jgi:hypothetical protein